MTDIIYHELRHSRIVEGNRQRDAGLVGNFDLLSDGCEDALNYFAGLPGR
jgi:hypothetical protein